MSNAEPIPLAPKTLEPGGVDAEADARGPELLPRRLPPKRLVADCRAEEPFPVAEVPFALEEPAVLAPPVGPPDEAVVEVVEPPEVLPPELSRCRSLRLPRSWGVTSETKFSATVTPVNRSVLWMVPAGETFAVLIPALVVTEVGAGALRRCQIRAAPPSIRRATMILRITPVLEGLG